MNPNNKPLLLDVDPSIIENNLLLRTENEELQSLFPENDSAYKLVTPSPGFCVKLRRKAGGEKVFVNVCHTKDIPPPEDITEDRLAEILHDSDGAGVCNYRVPLSIGEERQDPDKAGNMSAVYDVAINSTFFAKLQNSQMFKLFLIDVVLQGIEEKFHTELETDDFVVLKNRLSMGTLPAHRIRTPDRRDPSKPRAPLVQELASTSSAGTSQSAPLPTRSSPPREKPDFRLLKECKALVAQFKLPKAISATDVDLDVGEDRVVLNSISRNYHADFFLPDLIIQKWTTAEFDVDSRILTVTMPLVKAC